MDKLDTLFDDIINRIDYKTELVDPAEEILAEFSSIVDICRLEMEKFKKSKGTYKFNSDAYENTKESARRDSIKENIDINEETKLESPKRPKRNAAQKAEKNLKLPPGNAKLRCPTNITMGDVQNVYVKIEKLSLSPEKSNKISEPLEQPEVKVEKDKDEMPAPKKLPPRKKAVKRETSTSSKKSSRSQKKDSDVIIQEKEIVTIDISEKEEPQEKPPAQRVTRSKVVKQNSTASSNTTSDSIATSTKDSTISTSSDDTSVKSKKKRAKKKGSTKRNRSESSEDIPEETKLKRSKSSSDDNKDKDKDNTIETEYDDAVSTIEPDNKEEEEQLPEVSEKPKVSIKPEISEKPKISTKPVISEKPAEPKAEIVKPPEIIEKTEIPKLDSTFVTNSPINKNLGPTLDTTVVVENPKCVTANTVPKELLTDDESDKETAPPPSAIRTPKQVFSTYDQSPVKKKVEAFEKMAAAATLPPRLTRTKTKAKEQEQQNQTDKDKPVKEDNSQKKAPPVKDKYFTPVQTKFAPKVCSTAVTSQSTSKITDTIRKQKALLQAQIEEKKRKCEEKKMRVRQRAEELEKEKQKLLEQQRLKEEKHKRILAEQEEKRQKMKEDLERKRMLAKQKALEEQQKKEEMERKLAEQKKKEEEERLKKEQEREKELKKAKYQEKVKMLPNYMKTPAPLLPTYDCYDSDEEDREPVPYKKPSWANEFYLRKMQSCIEKAGHKVKNTFFSRQVQTIDLKEIFETNDPRVLKRTSSANWNRPPKYSVLPTLGEEVFHTSDEEEDEDED